MLKQLDKLGATKLLRLQQTDSYYNAPKSLKDFEETDESLRIRTTEEYNPTESKKHTVKHDITYKGAKLDTKVKARIEHICYIQDPEAMDQILKALEFRKVVTLIKDRQVFTLTFQEKKLEILLDQIEGLEGNYLEAEIMAESSIEQKQAKEILLKFIKNLGYMANDSILQSYLELYLKKH